MENVGPVGHGEDFDFCSQGGGSYRGFLSRGGSVPDSGVPGCPLDAVGATACENWKIRAEVSALVQVGDVEADQRWAVEEVNGVHSGSEHLGHQKGN